MKRLEIQTEFDNAMKRIFTKRSVVFTIDKLGLKDEMMVSPFLNSEYEPIDQKNEVEMTITDKFKKTREVETEEMNFNQVIVKDFLINNRNELVSSKNAYWDFIEGNLDEVLWHLAYKYRIGYKEAKKVFKRRKCDLEKFVLSTDVNEKRFSLFCKYFKMILEEENDKTFVSRFLELLK